MEADIQVRSEETGIRTFPTVEKAFDEAILDSTIWKISFNAMTGERVRLVRRIRGGEAVWIYEPMEFELPESG